MPLPHLKHIAPLTNRQRDLLACPKSAEVERIATAIIWQRAKLIRQWRIPYMQDRSFWQSMLNSKQLGPKRERQGRMPRTSTPRYLDRRQRKEPTV